MARNKKEPTPEEWVEAFVGVSKLKSQNKLLGGPTSAARQMRGARATGHSRDDVLQTSGEFKYWQEKWSKKKKPTGLRAGKYNK